jgi:hypothetical protein
VIGVSEEATKGAIKLTFRKVELPIGSIRGAPAQYRNQVLAQKDRALALADNEGLEVEIPETAFKKVKRKVFDQNQKKEVDKLETEFECKNRVVTNVYYGIKAAIHSLKLEDEIHAISRQGEDKINRVFIVKGPKPKRVSSTTITTTEQPAAN